MRDFKRSKIYDPLDLVTPISINAKILMYDIGKLNVDWDEPLDGEIRDRWLNIVQDLKESTNLTVSQMLLQPSINRCDNSASRICGCKC